MVIRSSNHSGNDRPYLTILLPASTGGAGFTSDLGPLVKPRAVYRFRKLRQVNEPTHPVFQ